MTNDENLVFLASTVLVMGLLAVAAITGVGDGNGVLVLVIFAGIGILAPQLYLARRGGDVPSQTRVRVALVLSMLYGWGLASMAAPDQRLLLALLTVGLFVTLVLYEGWSGYRESTAVGGEEP